MATDDQDKDKRKKEIEKHCELCDAHNEYMKDLCIELGASAEAVISRLFDKHFPETKVRKLTIRKWQNICRKAQARFLKI